MNYRSVWDLNSAIKHWIPELPNDLDLIVGIPRSGLLVANLLALYLNLPMADVDGLCNNNAFSTGNRYKYNDNNDLSKSRKVLVVDDSVCTGIEIKRTRSKIESNGLPHQIYYAAVYITPQGYEYVDYWHEIIDLPRVFEWNIMHHNVLTNSCVDIDGVLCRDPTEWENDDGENYQKFLINVKPLIVPTKSIAFLVTCRLEKYRNLTEEWMKKHNIKYKQLMMMDLPDKKSRIALGSHASFKAKVYKATNAELFIESSIEQAQEIARLAGKPVLCTETGQMNTPNFLRNSLNLNQKFINEVTKNPYSAFLRSMRFLNTRIRIIIWKIMAKKRKNI